MKNYTVSNNNNTTAYGYNNKSDKFMTVHVDSTGLFTCRDLVNNDRIESMIYQSYSGLNTTALIDQDITDILYEASVIRVDMGAGTAHVLVGAGVPNIFIPVNFTENIIACDQYAYILATSDSGDIIALLERCGRVKNCYDVRSLIQKAKMLAKSESFDNCKKIQIGDINIYIRTNNLDEIFEVTPFTTQGRRILACVKGLYGLSIAPVSDIKISEKSPCNVATKICCVDGKFYKWTYIADEKIVKEEISIPEYKNTGTSIIVSVKKDADIHGVIFKMSDGKYDDVVLSQDEYVKIKEDGDILEYLYDIHLSREAKRADGAKCDENGRPFRKPRGPRVG